MDSRIPKMPSSESGMSKFKRKCMEEPFVPLGTLATTVVLIGGLASFNAGKSHRTQQFFMRGRVAAQGFTVLAIAAGGVMSKTNWFNKEAASVSTATSTTPN